MMTHRSLSSFAGVVIAAASLLFPSWSAAQEGSVETDTGTAELNAAELNAAIDGYVAAYNGGQIGQVMSFWAENADFVDIRGRFHEGRDLISALFRRGFAENPGRTIELNSASRKFLSPNVAMDDGILELTSPDGIKSSGRYTVVWTKADGKWLIRSARDIPIEVEPSEVEDEASPMEQLDWMVGEWQAKSDEHELTMSCKWELDDRYLVQLFDVKSDEEVFRVINFVGFDPSEGRFRSWFFDSRGGFGGGPWTRVDDQYQISNLAVLPDGRLGSSVMKWRQTDPDTATFQATERVVGGQALPDSEQIYKRVK